MRAKLLTIALGIAVSTAGSASAQDAGGPVLESVRPIRGWPGRTLVISGRGLPADPNAMTVELDGTRMTIDSAHPDRWLVRIPAGARSGRIVLRTRGDGRARMLTGPVIDVGEAPPRAVVDRFEPDHGPPGTLVTFHGRQFLTDESEMIVRFGGPPARIEHASPIELRVRVPRGSRTERPSIEIAATHTTWTDRTFRVDAHVALTGLRPASAAPVGAQVEVQGAGFSRRASDNSVTLNGLRARVVDVNDSHLAFVVPVGATTGPLVVDVRGVGREQWTEPFVVAPRIASVEGGSMGARGPTFVPRGGLLRIHGDNFGTDPGRVWVALENNVRRWELTVVAVSPSLVVAQTPRGEDIEGELLLGVRPDLPWGYTLPAVRAGPVIVTRPLSVGGFNPIEEAPGRRVIVWGSGFTPVARDVRVLFSGVPARIVAASATRLTVIVPNARSGPVEVAVRGRGTARSERSFRVRGRAAARSDASVTR